MKGPIFLIYFPSSDTHDLKKKKVKIEHVVISLLQKTFASKYHHKDLDETI